MKFALGLYKGARQNCAGGFAMMSSKVIAAAAGAAIALYAGCAEARVIRSGGSSGGSNICDNDSISYGPFIGLFADGSSDAVTFFNDGYETPLQNLNDHCVGAYYEFTAGEPLEFEGSLAFGHFSMSENENVDTTFSYVFGPYQVTSDTFTGGPFDMPEDLLTITSKAVFSVFASLTLVAKEGFSFFLCTLDQFGNPCIKGEEIGDTLVYTSSSAYMEVLPSEVPLAPAALYFGAGALGLLRLRRRKAKAAR